MEYPPVDIWRMSASRPWQLEKTHPNIIKYIKYKGQLRYHIIESVIQPQLSQECLDIAQSQGYEIHKIDPAKGQGFAIDYALKNVITSKYSFKIEDDFMPIDFIPINDCIMAMEQNPHINQICFNKRPNLEYKWISEWDEAQQKCVKKQFEKEQRAIKIQDNDWSWRIFPAQVKDRWWFGSSVWRTSFIKPIFKFWERNTHNYFNDLVVMPMAGFVYGDESDGFRGRKQPTARQIEDNVGCYLYGYPGLKNLFEHTGMNDSLWKGDLQKRWISEGREVVGI